MMPARDAKYNKIQLVNDILEKLGVDGVMNGVVSISSDGRNSVRGDSRIGDDIVLQNGIYKSADSRPQKTVPKRETEIIVSLQMIIDLLNKDLKNALGEIKKLTSENEELKNKLNDKSKKDSNRLASSKNEFVQLINCKQYSRGGTVLPQEPLHHSRHVQNEPFFSANKYNRLQNITSTESKETANKSESKERGKATSKVVVLGDFLLKFAGKECKRKGYDVHCFPGIRIDEL
jgi:hypothetical protein